MSAIVDRLVAMGVVRRSDLRPCPPQSLRRLERDLGATLPADYREFLQVMGRGAGRFLRDFHIEAFYPAILRLNEELPDRLPDVDIPDQWFCFASHLGDDWLFLSGNGARADPPVYYVNESSYPRLRKGFPRFVDWLAGAVSLYEPE